MDAQIVNGMTLDEIVEAVQRQQEARRQGPTNPADIALKQNNMDITRNVIVPYQRHEYPKSLFMLKAAKGRTPARVLSKDVKDAQAEARAVAEGWSLTPVEIPVVEEDIPALTSEQIKALMGSTESVVLPMARRRGRPQVQAEA